MFQELIEKVSNDYIIKFHSPFKYLSDDEKYKMKTFCISVPINIILGNLIFLLIDEPIIMDGVILITVLSFLLNFVLYKLYRRHIYHFIGTPVNLKSYLSYSDCEEINKWLKTNLYRFQYYKVNNNSFMILFNGDAMYFKIVWGGTLHDEGSL